MNYAKFAIVVLMMPILLTSCSKKYDDVVLPVEETGVVFMGMTIIRQQLIIILLSKMEV